MSDNIHVLIRKVSDDCSVSGGSWLAGSPLANAQDRDVKRVARSTNTTTASAQMRFDCGGSPNQVWSMFAILNHNMTTLAKWRVVLTDSATDTGTRIYDSGLVNVWEPTIVFGSLPWGTFPWDGVNPSDHPSYPICFLIAESSYSARYLFIYIEDTTNPAGYIDLGRVLAGQAWSPSVNANYGLNIRYVDPSEGRRTRGGRLIYNTLPKYRVVDMEFTGLTEAEAMGPIFEWQKIGKTNDVLFVKNPNQSPALRFRNTIYGSLVDNQAIPELFVDRYSTRISIEEHI